MIYSPTAFILNQQLLTLTMRCVPLISFHLKKKVRPYASTMAHLQNLAYEKII